MYTLKNLTTSCYDSAPDYGAAPGDSSSGGLPTWATALIAVLGGCAALAAGALLLWWCWYRRRLQRQLAAADEERGGSKGGSGADLASLASGKPASCDDAPHDRLSRGGSAALAGQPSGELQSFLRTRVGPIDGVQLGELLGRGAYGRVYRGEEGSELPAWGLPAWGLPPAPPRVCARPAGGPRGGGAPGPGLAAAAAASLSVV